MIMRKRKNADRSLKFETIYKYFSIPHTEQERYEDLREKTSDRFVTNKIIIDVENASFETLDIDEENLKSLKGISLYDVTKNISQEAIDFIIKDYEDLRLSDLVELTANAPNSKITKTLQKEYKKAHDIKLVEMLIENAKELVKISFKGDFYNELLEARNFAVTNFLDVYTEKLKNLASEKYGQTNHYDCLSNALEMDGYREDANDIFEEMYKNPAEFLKFYRNHNNNGYIRRVFPDNVKKLEENVDKIMEFIPSELIKKYKKATYIKNLMVHELGLKEIHKGEVFDYAETNINTKEDFITCRNTFYKLNERPGVYNSSYNEYSTQAIAKVLKTQPEEWMVPILVKAHIKGFLGSDDRLGGRLSLFDAAKAWKCSLNIWKREAVKIGAMSLEARVVAGAIADQMYERSNANWHTNKELRNEFWQEFNQAQNMGWRKALTKYAADNAETKGRILTTYYENVFDEDTEKAIRGIANIKDVINMDANKVKENFKVLEEIYSKDVFLDTKNLVRNSFRINEIFDNNFMEYYNSLPEERKEKTRVISWLANGLSDEKAKSYASFIKKNLYYNDGLGNKIVRSSDELYNIGKVWPSLTPKEEEQDFDKVLAKSYTHKTETKINNSFNKCASKKLKDSENLRLYQKLLFLKTLAEQNDNRQINEDEIIKGVVEKDRKEALLELAGFDYAGVSIHFYDLMEGIRKKDVVNLVLGNNAAINDVERDKISLLNKEEIVGFKPATYQKTIDSVFQRVAEDKEAASLFRKHYVAITSDERIVSDDKKLTSLRDKYQSNKDWLIDSSLCLYNIYGANYQSYFNMIDNYNKTVDAELKKENENYSSSDKINVHDALYWLPNNLEESRKESFVAFTNKNFVYSDNNGIKHHRKFNEMEIIAKNWNSLSNEDLNNNFNDLLGICRSKKYIDQKYADFAEEAGKNGVYQDDYKRVEKIYEQGLGVPTLWDTNIKFSSDNLTGRLLPREDPRAGFFGQHTNCCQHFYSAGSACAISSIRDPFSGLFVIENQKGDIVAGSWVWESKVKDDDGNFYKGICFDNIEGIGEYQRSSKVMDIYKQTLPYLASLNYQKISVGTGMQDADVSEFAAMNKPIPLPKRYSGYTDAHSQRLMLHNEKATAVEENEGDIYVCGALESDLPAMNRVAYRCFPDGDSNIVMPDDPQALLLKDQEKVVGYTLWTENETEAAPNGENIKNWIYDMAVLPEYRKNVKQPGSLMLMNALMEKVKDSQEVWGAEVRDVTTLKYLQFMADEVKGGEKAGIEKGFQGRAKIDLEILDHHNTMSDGTKVYSVKFKVLSQEETEKRLEKRKQKGTALSSKIKSLILGGNQQ